MELAAGRLSAGLAPEVGGSLAFFRIDVGGRAVDLMRPLSDAERAARNPVGAAMFPMVPYANRIAGNRFTFRGETYTFTANNPPEKFNVHGDGWHSPWSAKQAGADEAVLELDSNVPGSPYRYFAWQRFALTDRELVVTIGVQNRGPRAMPFGFGEHPWLIRDPDVAVAFAARDFWFEGWDNVASERIATPPELAFDPARPLPKARRNNCYGGWDGTATMTWPARGVGLAMTAEPIFGHLMLFTDPARGDFCLEPQTNATCAFNVMADGFSAEELGVIILEPGEKAEGTIRFRPFTL